MHISRLDLNLLVVFDAIFSESSITRASTKLFLTQPAVSHALARLRSAFSDPLFVREGRAMLPTARARQLIQPIRVALRGLELGLNELEHFTPSSATRRFAVGIRDVLEPALLPPLMQRLEYVAPQVDIVALRIERRQTEAELASGSLDVALDVLLPMSERIKQQRVAVDHIVVLMRVEHPIANQPLTLESYLAQQHVLVSSRRAGASLEDLELSRHGLQRRIRLRCQHYYTACRVVHQSDLLLTMPGSLAQVINATFGHRIRAFPITASALDVYLYWHAMADSDPANRWLREQLSEVLQSAVKPVLR